MGVTTAGGPAGAESRLYVRGRSLQFPDTEANISTITDDGFVVGDPYADLSGLLVGHPVPFHPVSSEGAGR